LSAIYTPLDGLIVQDSVHEVYKFRKRIGRKFGVNKDYRNGGIGRMQCRKINKQLSKDKGVYTKLKRENTSKTKGGIQYNKVTIKIGERGIELLVPDYELLQPF
jgi:hypothetical protein